MAYSTHGGEGKCTMILVRKAEGRRPPGNHRCRLKYSNIKMNLREIDWGGMDWIDLALDNDQ
jgi:hypothetical protein